MEPNIAIVIQYVDVIKSIANGVKIFVQRSVQAMLDLPANIVSLTPTVEDALNGLNFYRKQIEDNSPIEAPLDMFKNLLSHYAWVSTCLFACSFSNVIFGKVLFPLTWVVLGPLSLALLTFLFCPLAIFDTLPRRISADDEEKRVYQLLASALNGFLFGVFTRQFFVPHWSPPHFLLVFFEAFFGNSVAPTLADQPRTTFLLVMVGFPSIVNLLLGLLTGSMCGTYLSWILALTVVAALDLQLKVALFKSGHPVELWHQGISIVAFMMTSFVMTIVSAV